MQLQRLTHQIKASNTRSDNSTTPAADHECPKAAAAPAARRAKESVAQSVQKPTKQTTGKIGPVNGQRKPLPQGESPQPSVCTQAHTRSLSLLMCTTCERENRTANQYHDVIQTPTLTFHERKYLDLCTRVASTHASAEFRCGVLLACTLAALCCRENLVTFAF